MFVLDFVDTIKKIIQSCLEAMEYRIKHAKFDKTFKARVVGRENESKYNILYKNTYYTAFSDSSFSVGDIVNVCAPNNNWSELFIIPTGNDLRDAIYSLNSDLAGKVVQYSFVFGSENAVETYLFGTTYAKIPLLIGMRIGSVQVIFSNITRVDVGVDRIIVTRDAAASYAGISFDIVLFIPN